MVGLGALAFYQLLANMVAGAGKTKMALWITILLIGISFCSGLILIPKFGLVGAAMQTTIAGIIGFTLLFGYTFRTFKIPVPVASIIRIITATAVAVAPTYIWKPHTILLPLQYLVLFALYGFMLWLLREIQPIDIQHIRSVHPILARYIPAPKKSA
jgi:O-antigen/teichoic acid export membrane protein